MVILKKLKVLAVTCFALALFAPAASAYQITLSHEIPDLAKPALNPIIAQFEGYNVAVNTFTDPGSMPKLLMQNINVYITDDAGNKVAELRASMYTWYRKRKITAAHVYSIRLVTFNPDGTYVVTNYPYVNTK